MPYVPDGLTERSRKDGVKEIVANSFVTLGDSTSALRVGTDLSSRQYKQNQNQNFHEN